MARGLSGGNAKKGSVLFRFLGETRELEKDVDKVEKKIGGMAGRASTIFNKAFSKITSTLGAKFGDAGNEVAASLNGMASEAVAAGGAIGVAVAAGAATAGAAIVGLAAKGISAFQGLASEIRGLQRATGGSAEEASRLNAVLQALNVDSTTGQRAFFLLSKTIDTSSKKLTDHGIQIAKNADSSVDLYQTLLNVRDAYQAAGQGAEGNAIAAAAFGKSGQALLPVLGATADRLKEIDDAAKRHHEFLSQDQIDKAKQLSIASKELQQSIQGLEIELGTALAPAALAATHALEEAVHVVDDVGNVVGKVGSKLGILPRVLSYVVPFGNVLRGLFGHHENAATAAEDHASAEADFADAEEAAKATTDAYNQSLDDTLGAHLKAAQTSSSLGDALSKLSDDSKGVDDSVSGATAKVRTFQDAMHDGFDSVVDANQAALDYADSLDALNEALNGTAQGSESAADAMARLTGHGSKAASDPRAIQKATNAAVKAAEQEVDAEVASGQVADTAQARKEALRQKLVDLETQFPAVKEQVDKYISSLDKVPNLTTKAEDSTKKLSKAKKDLSDDIYDVIQKAKDEADQMKTTGTALDGAYQKHWALLNVLTYLQAAYPALSGIIGQFITDVQNQWNTFLATNPDAANALANSFGTGSFGAPTSPGGLGGAIGPALGAVAPIATGSATGASAPSSGRVQLSSAPTVVQNIYGDGLNSKEVADHAVTRFKRATVGTRAA